VNEGNDSDDNLGNSWDYESPNSQPSADADGNRADPVDPGEQDNVPLADSPNATTVSKIVFIRRGYSTRASS